MMTAARRRRAPGLSSMLIAVLVGAGTVVFAQPASERSPQQSRDLASAVLQAAPSPEPAPVTFFNRRITTLRATVLGRAPSERARTVERTLNDLADQHLSGPIESRLLDGGALITIASKAVLVLAEADVDELSGETLEAVTARTVDNLQGALTEAVDARSLPAFLRSAAAAIAGLALGVLLVWALTRANRALSNKLVRIAEQTATRAGLLDLESLRSSRVLELQRWIVRGVYIAFCALIAYVTIGFVLREFPYTRPWGTSMRGFLLDTVVQLGLDIVNAIPGLFTAALILLLARFAVRLVALWFGAVERGQVKARWIYPDTAQPTRRLLITLVWLFAVVMAYPYLPGSNTEAFKGVTVFLGLMVTFGSTGLVNHIMAGFMITYARALRSGDFVRIGDIEGTVQYVGVLSTKVLTLKGEEVTIPNAVIVGQTITDYSRPGDTAGVFTPTSVTIGYDTPWRQVHAMLLLAAERTPGLRREPKPFVFQESLEDYYVKYTLWVCLERQQTRLLTFDTLHAHIQDLFNEHGVQIMSPNYMMDPAVRKVVPRQDWYAAPAQPEASSGVSDAQPA